MPALDQQDYNDNFDISAMDLEAFAFRRGGKDASLCGNSPLADIFPASWTTTMPASILPTDGIIEVPSWEPQQQQAQQQDSRSTHVLTHQDSVSSDEGFSTSTSEEFQLAAAPSPSAPAMSPMSADGDLGSMSEEDAAMEDEMLMSPEEEARLRSLLAKKQQDLENCTSKMKGLTPQNKKRLRNRHASCVSRLKKKLYICNLQRDLERARAIISTLHADAEAQKGTISFFRRENDRLCSMVQQRHHQANAPAVAK